MAKRGRPKFEINPDVIEKVESLAANGLTKEEVALCLGISYQTLNEKTKENSDFSEAISRGKAKGIAVMANNLVKLAKAGNAAANIFFLKARAKWREGDLDIEALVNQTAALKEEMRAIRDELDAKNKRDY